MEEMKLLMSQQKLNQQSESSSHSTISDQYRVLDVSPVLQSNHAPSLVRFVHFLFKHLNYLIKLVHTATIQTINTATIQTITTDYYTDY